MLNGDRVKIPRKNHA